MDFRILGPLEATDDTRPVKLTGGKQQALLALLLLNADRVVSMDRLVDDLWGEDVPETAQKMVQILVSQLRKQLPDGLLRTSAPGYLVDLDGHSLDLRRFDELVEEGRETLGQGQAEIASVHFQNALALWRGPALQEFQEPFALLESSRLEEQRLACLEERIEADLALARHAELVGELDALVRRHPHRERLRGQLMLALYRSGRHAEALESYRAYRQMLADGVGIDPSARLRELERRMLQQDPALDSHGPPSIDRRTPVGGRGRVGLPPAPTASPYGRERELTHIARLLDEAHAGERRLVFVTGEAGIGKTTIVESLVSRAGAAAQTFVAQGQCVAHRGAGEPYLPVLDALGRLTRQPDGRRFVPLLARQAPTWLAQMPWLLTDDELESVQRRMLGATHLRMLREMVETLEAISQEITLVLVLEDLHWSDLSTVDLLDAIARRSEPARLLVVGTYRRSDAVAHEHPVHRLGQELRSAPPVHRDRGRPAGSRTAVEQYVSARVGASTPPEVAAVLGRAHGRKPAVRDDPARLVARAGHAGRGRARRRTAVG